MSTSLFLPNINGMESALLIAAIVVLYSYGFHVAGSGLNGRCAVLLGVILGFVLLARLDMVFIALALLGWGVPYILNRETRSRAIATIMACGFATCAVVAPYLVVNSTRRVINLDGIVNNMDFQRTLVQHRLGEYLRENHVDFLVQHAVHNREDVIAGRYNLLELRFPSRRFDGFSDSVSVRAQTEVYRSTRFFDGPYPSVLVIWLLH